MNNLATYRATTLTPGRRLLHLSASILVALIVVVSPISTSIIGGIGGTSAAIELFFLVVLILLCLILQKGSIAFDGRVVWLIVGFLFLSAIAEFAHLLQPVPPVPAFFSDYRRAGTLLILALVMLSAGLVRRTLPEEVIFCGFRIACISIAVFFVILWTTFFAGLPDLANPRGTVRVVSDDEFVGFNLFAFFSLFSGITALFFRSALIRYPIIGLSILLAVALGSRNTLLALSFGYVGYVTAYALANPDHRRVGRLVTLTYIIAVPIILATLFEPALWDWLWNKLLGLNSAGRGLESGFTGRTEIWARAVAVWQESPLVGNGFRILNENPHNGYLQVLAELGVLGLVWFVLFIAGSATRAFSQTRRRPEYGVILAYSIAFASFNVFDSRPLNASNSVTLGFFFLAAYVLGPCSASMRGNGSGASDMPNRRASFLFANS